MGDTVSQETQPTPRRWLWIVIAVVTLGLVLGALALTKDTADVQVDAAPPPLISVSVSVVDAEETIAEVTGFAEVRPRWNAELRAAVSGRVVVVHKAALVGEQVTAGEPLFQIERTQYETSVASAELALAQSELELLRAQNKTEVARRQFTRGGTTPPTDLAIHLPELRIAERAVATAQAQLRAAGTQLKDTTVSAPFSGFVTERIVSLGQTVGVGESLARLVDDSSFEMTVELAQANWNLLDHPLAGQAAQVFSADGTPLAAASIRQGGGFLDQDTRQYRIFLDVVADNANGVLSGDFLRVALKGKPLPNTMDLPETALTRAGHIWVVGENDELVRLEPKILFRRDDRLVIQAPEDMQSMRVSTTPLASFLPGQRVSPKEE